MDLRTVRQVGQRQSCGIADIGELPAVKSFFELWGARQQLRREHELLEIIVREGALHGGFPLFQPAIAFRLKELLPVRAGDFAACGALVQDGQYGFRLVRDHLHVNALSLRRRDQQQHAENSGKDHVSFRQDNPSRS